MAVDVRKRRRDLVHLHRKSSMSQKYVLEPISGDASAADRKPQRYVDCVTYRSELTRCSSLCGSSNISLGWEIDDSGQTFVYPADDALGIFTCQALSDLVGDNASSLTRARPRDE
ncbi:hypothetical protein VTK73DRAFT_2603 [Phialemonium thermophilum]|uniref:Uncharacterized protein n=1 Tax=Phialemonium thermophilum TaxID=223376 RepID=A0ABR3X4I9_9PEZI